MKIQSIAMRWAWYIWKDAVKSWETQFPSTVRTWADACREAWILAKEEFYEVRDNVTKTARKVLGVVRVLVARSVEIADKTISPSTAGEITRGFTIEFNRRDFFECKGKRRPKRSSYLRPAMNKAIFQQVKKEYRP